MRSSVKRFGSPSSAFAYDIFTPIPPGPRATPTGLMWTGCTIGIKGRFGPLIEFIMRSLNSTVPGVVTPSSVSFNLPVLSSGV